MLFFLPALLGLACCPKAPQSTEPPLLTVTYESGVSREMTADEFLFGAPFMHVTRVSQTVTHNSVDEETNGDLFLFNKTAATPLSMTVMMTLRKNVLHTISDPALGVGDVLWTSVHAIPANYPGPLGNQGVTRTVLDPSWTFLGAGWGAGTRDMYEAVGFGSVTNQGGVGEATISAGLYDGTATWTIPPSEWHFMVGTGTEHIQLDLFQLENHYATNSPGTYSRSYGLSVKTTLVYQY